MCRDGEGYTQADLGGDPATAQTASLLPADVKGYPVAGWWADPRAAAVAEALAPLDWRNLTERKLARRAVGAVDRFTVALLLSGVPGTRVGKLGPVDPADRGDPRVEHLVRMLRSRQWRALSLDRLCADLVSSLAAWQLTWQSTDRSPRGMPDDR